ncbi:hypothetical protein SAMN02746065_13713 [Desulfocicer vacuolatum DSM 3385]|uniref:Uncharacterized protein n=1 Tax=Desulfocicer vacuolatum DSM 3385 TaxID=1121400 RepID=A0A1W2ENZ3_9BACT|nr:hypothetical protein SAMN02746065_13713 [Desulfocicer vacuolatum DSM 3385]
MGKHNCEKISWWGQAFVIDIIEAFFAGKGLGR